MSFTIENEKQNQISLLDATIIREYITTSVYHKHFEFMLAFYDQPKSLVLSTHLLMDASKYVQDGENYTVACFL